MNKGLRENRQVAARKSVSTWVLNKNLKQNKPRKYIRKFIHGLKTWGNTKKQQPVDGELPVTECRQKDKILYMR